MKLSASSRFPFDSQILTELYEFIYMSDCFSGQQETKPDQPIIFTKQPDTAYRTQPKPAETFQTKLVNPLGKQKIPLKISRDVLDSIEHYQTQFAKHLKRVSHQAVGKFDPWKLVEE